MFARPSLRAVLATTAAAALLVGGADLASYAATHHSASAGAAGKPHAQPKTIAYHLGLPGKSFQGSSTHLFTAKVPKGTYEVSISGWLNDTSGNTSDNYTCLVADKRTLFHVLRHPGNLSGAQRLYAVTGQSDLTDTFDFAVVGIANPVAKVDRSKVVYGCLLNGTGPFHIVRPLVFSLRPVSATNKTGKPLALAKMKARQLSHALR